MKMNYVLNSILKSQPEANRNSDEVPEPAVTSGRCGLSVDSLSSSLKLVVELPDVELEQRSKRILRLQGMALSYLVDLQSDVKMEKVARGVELYVAKGDLYAKVERGMTIRLDAREPDGWGFGRLRKLMDKRLFVWTKSNSNIEANG